MQNFENEEMYADGSDFPVAPAGNHLAVCIGVVQLGKIDVKFEDKVSRKQRVMVFFELVNTKDDDGNPHIVSIEHTYTVGSKSNLKKMIDGWRGEALTPVEAKAFNIVNVIGAPCLANVLLSTSKKGRNYNKIATIAPAIEGVEVPESKNPHFLFNFNPPFKTEVFNALPEWVQNKIKGSDEYIALSGGTVTVTNAPVAQPINAPVTNAPVEAAKPKRLF